VCVGGRGGAPSTFPPVLPFAELIPEVIEQKDDFGWVSYFCHAYLIKALLTYTSNGGSPSEKDPRVLFSFRVSGVFILLRYQNPSIVQGKWIFFLVTG
jgi:hypothetical protein